MRERLHGKASIVLLTSLALVAFAANSILCRAALAKASIDPGSFTAIRVLSGALTLLVLFGFSPGRTEPGAWRPRGARQWLLATMLFVYAIAFSLAYVQISAATGALLLFGAVQLTMLCLALSQGDGLRLLEGVGLVLAFAGVIYLLLPGVQIPSLGPGLLMLVAGAAWGVYSVVGKGTTDPLGDTRRSFVGAVPMVLLALVVLVWRDGAVLSVPGALLAVASGALASGLGYVAWYAALPGLRTTQAGVLQLLVPIIAAAGGVMLLGERLTPASWIAALLTLGGVLMVLRTRAVRTGVMDAER